MPQLAVLQPNTKRETGKKAQEGNIQAAKAVADIIRTTLGPKSMLKMLLDPSGSIHITNDGHAILREIDVSHPAAKSVIELSRTQDEEVGDGTTSVIILAGELLHNAQPLLARNVHPTVIVRGYRMALADALKAMGEMAIPIQLDDDVAMKAILKSSLATKFTHRYGDLMGDLALSAIRKVAIDLGGGQVEIDVKKYAKVEKVTGGDVMDSRVLQGVMFAKDVVLPGRMSRKIEKPRVLLMDSALEYKKGENQTNVELMKEEDWAELLRVEEEWIKSQCDLIAQHKPTLVITEKGLSDLAAHYLQKEGISAIRRLRKTDNNRIARATGATVVHRADEIRESDIGTKAGLFEVRKIADDYWTFIVDCEDPKACTVLLRGPSKEILNEFERNLTDALGVARNIALDPQMLPGGGCTEMGLAKSLQDSASKVEGVEADAYRAVAKSLEVIPRTLAQNCGANVIRTITALRGEHTGSGPCFMGIDGEKGVVANMKEQEILEPFAVKAQTLKTSIESSILLLRIDDIVSGIGKKDQGGRGGQGMQPEDHENVDPERALAE